MKYASAAKAKSRIPGEMPDDGDPRRGERVHAA